MAKRGKARIIATENGSLDFFSRWVLLFGLECPGIGRYGGSDGLACLVSPRLVSKTARRSGMKTSVACRPVHPQKLSWIPTSPVSPLVQRE